MSSLFEFEKNLETEVSDYLSAKGYKAYPTRGFVDIEASNIQVALEYQGALDTHRQVYKGFQEYDLHMGSIVMQVNTYRDENLLHHSRIGAIRQLMLNGDNGFRSNLYTVFDLMPENASHTQIAENNLDQSLLSYSIKWKVDLSKLQT